MRDSKGARILIFLIGSSLYWGSPLPAQATPQNWSAGVRENFVSRYDFNFGSDGMARIKYGVFKQGFKSITITTRLAVKDGQGSYVALPPIRTVNHDIETLISRIIHAEGELVIKPLLSISPGLGIIDRATGISPLDPTLFFETYGHAIGVYAGLASRREVKELVVGVGLHTLWNERFSAQWISLLQRLKKKVGECRLSFELSSEADFVALREWSRVNPASFAQVVGFIDRIRITVSPHEDAQGHWDSAQLQNNITALVGQSIELFGKKPITLANVTIPACKSPIWTEDEVRCSGEVDFKHQAEGLETWFAAFKNLGATIRKQIAQTEFREATTADEPNPDQVDARFLYYSPLARDIFTSQQNNPEGILPLEDDLFERTPALESKTACIYYDEINTGETLGQIQSRMLESVLGAFPSWQVKRQSIATYQAGDLGGCTAAFYNASHYGLAPPQAFFKDASRFSRQHPLVWLNYKLGAFAAQYNSDSLKLGHPPLGFDSLKIAQPLQPPSPSVEDPGFFRYFDYKSETFEKQARWDRIADRYSNSPELNLVSVLEPSQVRVLAVARHSKTGETSPYAVVHQQDAGSFWYFADLPFSFVHYEDRYLIFCDLLWDILGETPPAGAPGALVRIEDVNPSQDQVALRWAIDFLADHQIPFSLAVIPYFSNLYGGEGPHEEHPVWAPVTEYPEFIGTLKYAKARGANFVFHGVAHQAGDLIGGFDGISAADYEFWLYPQNRPVPQDSADYLIGRLEQGEEVFQKLGIRPVAWELPHYASSALDLLLFGKLFEWNYHRSIYFKADVDQAPLLEPKHRFFDCLTSACREERLSLARATRVTANYSDFGGQVIPYPVWRDSYGQSLIPETLGMIDYPFFYNDTLWRPVSRPSDLLRRAKKLRAVRGAYASFFWHPDLTNPTLKYYQSHPGNFETEGGKNTLLKMIEGIQALGYRFQSIGDCRFFPSSTCH